MELQIVPPTGEPLLLPLPPSTTIAMVMAMVAEKRKLNPAHYNLALPPEDPKVLYRSQPAPHFTHHTGITQGEGVACFGSMSVSRLKTHTLYLRRQGGAPEEISSLNNSDEVTPYPVYIVDISM